MSSPRRNYTVDPTPDTLAQVVHRNIDALIASRQELERNRALGDRIADRVTRFAGSLPFVVVHLTLFGTWIVWNVLPSTAKWDPYPFVMLAMFASVEAIFLSTFVLISQNRMSALAEKRAELDLQISLLSEHETTRVIQIVEAIARKVGVEERWAELEELKRDVAPEEVLRAIDEQSP